MADIATDLICNRHRIFIVGVISCEKDLNLRMLIEEETKVFATTLPLVSSRTENQSDFSSLMGFNHIDEFFQTVTIVGIVDEDLGSIFLCEDFHTSRDAGCRNSFFDVLQTGSETKAGKSSSNSVFLIEVADELDIIITSEFTCS